MLRGLSFQNTYSFLIFRKILLPITMNFKTLLCLTCVLSSGLLVAQDGWEPLFNGNNLDGWVQRGGEAPYTVENGVIVGTAIANSPNSFLCTKKDYGDFILELAFQVDPRLNTGVQFRSLSSPSYQNGRVHGYQYEIDPSPRAYTGGIYDEGRRGWLYPLSYNTPAKSAYNQAVWNTVRIEAIGNEIRTWLNGVPCTNLVDDMTSSGFIALQVHSIANDRPDLIGTQVRFRDIRIKTTDLESSREFISPSVYQHNMVPNTLSEQESRMGWRLLWDGSTSNGWRGAKLEGFPTSGWVMKDGVLTIQSSGGGESTAYGDIVTVDQFSNFELSLEFKITEGANSGIKYFVDPGLNQGAGSAFGLEYQILDDVKHPDAKLGVAGNRTVGSLYDLIAAQNLSVPERPKDFRGVGNWNHARIVVRGDHVEHWLNGGLVVTYERHNQMFRSLIAYSKYKSIPGFGEAASGHILLQDHGDEVSFRSIKIREF